MTSSRPPPSVRSWPAAVTAATPTAAAAQLTAAPTTLAVNASRRQTPIWFPSRRSARSAAIPTTSAQNAMAVPVPLPYTRSFVNRTIRMFTPTTAASAAPADLRSSVRR